MHLRAQQNLGRRTRCGRLGTDRQWVRNTRDSQEHPSWLQTVDEGFTKRGLLNRQKQNTVRNFSHLASSPNSKSIPRTGDVFQRVPTRRWNRRPNFKSWYFTTAGHAGTKKRLIRMRGAASCGGRWQCGPEYSAQAA